MGIGKDKVWKKYIARKGGEMDYKKIIIEILEEIENTNTLIKILAVVKTHYEILKEKGED